MKRGLIIIFIFLSTVKLMAQGDFPIQIDIMIPPPYPHTFESYFENDEQLIVTITNLTDDEQELRFHMSLEGQANGVSIRTRPEYRPVAPFILGPGETREYYGSNVEDIGISINLSDLLVVPPELNLNNRILPEGSYDFCITAYAYDSFDDMNPLSRPEPAGCAFINIEYPDAPDLNSPEDGDYLTGEIPTVNVLWTQPAITNPVLLERVEYRVRVVDMTQAGQTEPNMALSDETTDFVVNETTSNPGSYTIEDDVWIQGHQYAIHVIAYDPLGEFAFQQGGRSNAAAFYFGSQCLDPEAYAIEPHFPMAGDTIPYMNFPLIGGFTPWCDDYWRLDFSVSCTDGTSRTGQNPWPDGALAYVERTFGAGPGATWDHASKFAFDSEDDVRNVSRGQSYSWQVNTTMNMRDGRNWSSSISPQSFVVGMPKAQHQYPAANDTLRPGDITFRWLTGGDQARIVPEYMLFHVQNYVALEAVLGDVHEHWALQVFSESTPSASSLVRHTSGSLDVLSSEFFDASSRRLIESSIQERLLKELDHTFNFPEEGDYWWRMVWLKDPDQSVTGWIPESEVYHASGMRKFTIDEDGSTSTPVAETDPESECNAPCTFPVITDRTAVGGLETGGTFSIAGFSAEVESITSSSGNRYNGRALVEFSYLNNIRVRFDMNDIQVNAAGQAFAGNLTPVVDQSYPFSQVVTPLGTAIGMDSAAAQALDAGLTSTGKLISLLTGGDVNLPVGLDKTIDGNRIIVGIIDIQIKPNDAKLKAVVNLNMPNFEIVEGFVSLGAEICISATGFSTEGRLYLPQDQVYDLTDGNQFRVAGVEGGRPMEEVTYVEWDCKGFKTLNLSSIFRFRRDWLLPENPDGTIREEGNVEARVRGKFSRGMNIMGMIDIDPFQIPGVENWSFTVADEAWIDLSDLENPTGLQAALPDDYTHASMASETMRNTWKGFWLKTVRVTTPEQLQGPGGGRLSFSMRNLIIDNSGISFSARAENILSWEEEEGSMSGWKASLDTVFFDLAQNNFRAAGFNGKLGIPITEQTQYLNYSAALQFHAENDSFAFVVNVQPRANLTIPISMATASIERSSYVRVVLTGESYIEANLTATLNISDSNLSGGNSMPASMNMPGVRIQNLRVNSKTGFDDSEFSYSLTSPQKDMSGFPISLEHFSVSNEGIVIEPKITLSEGNDGFAASARVTLHIDMDLFSSPQRFDLTGVSLNRIEIGVTTSDVSLNGFLDFYKETTAGVLKEGVRGGITLGLNLGTKIEAQINAEFGTIKAETATVYDSPDWYSYFYVDGMFIIGSGITIFSGLNLYGLGGGFYHHMQQVEGSSMPGGAGVLGGSNGAPSGVTYEPHFGTDLGLKFTVILGSSGDQGKAYNIDVGLEAEFSFAHGLTRLEFKGSFRVMTDGVSASTVGRAASDSPVAGYVSMELHLPPYDDATFDGQFFVQVQVPPGSPILRGLGDIPDPPPGWTSENAMVWAEFFVGPDEWYFNMGTPDNRCGIALSLGDVNIAEVSNYLMIGHRVPTTLPEPHEDFIRIYNLGLENPEQSVAGGNVNDLMGGQPNPNATEAQLGEGFAFGLAMSFNFSMQFPPFYFDLSTVMGADVNVSRSDSRTCAGSSRVPGIDGWYGTGQMYAAIEGEFGVGIDLFFIKGRFPILSASAALRLEGGLPNPEWVRGSGSFYYSILNGLVEGRCAFDMSLGEVCHPIETGNPFGDLALIQDLKPANGATDVSIFVAPQASFALPMNEVIEVPESYSSLDPPVIRYLKPYIHKFKVKPYRSSIDSLACTRTMKEDNYIAEILPEIALNGESRYEVYVEARAYELNTSDGRWYNVYVDGRVFREDSLAVFTTGPAPDVLVDENIDFTYPYINQQSFLKDETIDHQGYVRLRQGRPEILGTMGEFEENEVTFYARFTSEGGAEFETPMTITDAYKLLKFDIAPLQNSTTYCVQLIRKDVPPNSITHFLDQSTINAINGPNPALNGIQSVVIQNFQASIGGSTFTSETLREIDLPADNAKPYEKVIYAYYFRTSEFNTMKAKLNAGGSWTSDHASLGSIELPNIEKVLEEKFEWVDMETFKVVYTSLDRARSFSPRVKVFLRQSLNDEFDPFYGQPLAVNSYLRYRVFPNTRSLRARLVDISNRLKRDVPLYASQFGNVPYVPYMNYLDFAYFDASTPRQRPLTESEINQAFDPGGSATASSGTTWISQSSTNTWGISFSGWNFSVPKTKFNYDVNMAGLLQYDRWQRRMASYAFRRVITPYGAFWGYPEIIDFMNTSERNWVEYHLDQNPSNRMRLNPGYHEVGIYYTYPDTRGYDRKGSLHAMRFYQ